MNAGPLEDSVVFVLFLVFIYLTAPCLSCSTWDLWYLLGYVGSSVAA